MNIKPTSRPGKRLALCFAALGSAVTLSGCMTTSPVWDQHFGEAVTAVTQAQIINPDAPAGLPSAPGADGKLAATAMTNYERSLIRLQPGGAGNGGGTGVGFGAGGYGGMSMGASGAR